MVAYDALFVSLVQCATSKTSITQQSFLCPTCQDAREFHTSVHLRVNGLEQQRKQSWWNSRGRTHDASPLAMANDPTAPESPPAAGEAECMTSESQLLWHPQGTRQWWRQGSFQSWWCLRFWPSPMCGSGTLEPDNPRCSGAAHDPCFSPGHGGSARNPGDLGDSGGPVSWWPWWWC